MGQLTAKDVNLNWYTPESVRRSRSHKQDDDFLIITRFIVDEHPKAGRKYNNYSIRFNRAVIQKYYGIDVAQKEHEDEQLPVAISFEKRGLVFCFNPKKGVPFMHLRKSGRDRLIYTRKLVDDIWEHFKLSKDTFNYLIKLRYFAELNGMMLYFGTPYHHDTKLPVFEDELYPNGRAS